ncbi:MAG: hypothetical protein PHG00_03050 [Methylococcales bacterium]|nr:hypothetical protein [Methylococcales bacterium]
MKKSTVHNLTKTLALISLLAPASGYPLGIGGIKLHSALNQNLNAEIPLVVSAREKASDIKVNLASPDKFDQAGVPWAAFLSKIKFTTVAGANGSMVIKLSSNEAVKEPFLNFLLEVSWATGSLFREFTVLVDPPGSYEQSTLAATPGDSNYQPQQEVVSRRQIIQRQQEEIGGASEYGPTGRNDTLWKIAEQVGKREVVSVEQAMIAVHKANPHAFYQDNMNALLAGKMLKIPDRKDVLKFSRTQAMAELNQQTKAWKSHLSQPIPMEAAKAKEASDNQLMLVAPEDAVSGKVEAAPESEQITSKQTATAEPQAADEEAVISPVDGALQDKVAELEKQLATIQQIIILKDQQLAAMQEQLQAKPSKAVPNTAETTLSQQKPAAQAIANPPVKPEPEAGAFLDPYYLWVGGIGIGVLSLLGWVWRRKRQVNNEETDIQTSFVASPSLVKDGTVYDAEAAGESTLLGEVNSADFDVFDKDQGEIDPVSEADVYLAYGRYKQAEDLMQDTLKEHPDRDECKLKLLEIYYSKKDKQAFESYAGQLAEKGKKDDVDFWAKVMEMAKEMCPDSILYSSGTAGLAAEKATIFETRPINTIQSDVAQADMTAADIKKADFAPAAFNESVDNETIKEQSEPAGLLNFNSASFNDDIVDDDWKNNESIDFDSGGLTGNKKSGKVYHDVLEKSQEIAGKDEFESLAFNFYVKPVEENEVDEIEFSAVNDFGEYYQHIDFSAGKGAELTNDPLEGDFEFDFDMSVEEQDTGLNDMDELETKLDLAMAYIDMNDSDAAKDIAREVLEKGSPEQQVTAQTLLDRLK